MNKYDTNTAESFLHIEHYFVHLLPLSLSHPTVELNSTSNSMRKTMF